MKLIKHLALLALVCFAWQQAASQDSLQLSFDEFKQIVWTSHPYAKQASLQLAKGESSIRRARGNFDPKLSATVDNKQYNGTNYYSLTSANLKIPTAAAVELKAGFDLNKGDYLGLENYTPNDGLITAGVSVPLLQGLIIDERRTALTQAKAFNEYSIAEQQIMMNDLLLKSYNTYWEWWASYEKEKVARNILSVASNRFNAVRERALAGQAPIIDTVEANIQVLLRQQLVQEAQANEIKSRMALSSYVWDKNNEEVIPRVLSSRVVPLATEGDQFTIKYTLTNYLVLLDSIVYYNPFLKQYDARMDNINAEEKMKREKLKPKLNLNYNLLAEPTGTNDNQNFSTNNYKWGVDFSLPLLLRTERGDLQLTRIKQEEIKLELQQKTQELKNRARSTYENILLLGEQLKLAETNVANYALMLEGERIKFFNGESSLFLVNQRELQYAEAQNKLVDLKLKLKIVSNELTFLLGIIAYDNQ
jgi:outer membrane protein TolC